MAIRVLHVGLGPIGAGVLRQVAGRRGFEPVAVVDVDPAKVGRDAGEVCDLEEQLGIDVEESLETAVARGRADVAALCTGSSLAALMPDLETILGACLPVVSTCEELSHPHFGHPDLAQRVDKLARDAGSVVLGTGVNPGFAMDTLPIVLTGACERVDSIVVDRVQDASQRRLPFQRKIGVGMEVEDFRRKVERGDLGHVGLTESIGMIASALGWELEQITERIEPKVAEQPVKSGAIAVAAGQVAGLIQDGTCYRGGVPVIRLHMEAFLGAPRSFDTVRIVGSPSLTSTVEGGIPGDVATASMTVNAMPRVLTAPPGLRTMPELPPVRWWSGS